MTDITLSPALLKALRIAPLLINTFTLQYSLDEHLFLSAFTHPSSTPLYTQRATLTLPQYLRFFLQKGAWMIIIHYPLNLALAGINLFGTKAPSGIGFCSTRQGGWYAAGLCLTAAHMFWGPRALRLLAEIQEEEDGKRRGGRTSVSAMKEWLGMNTLRSLVADFPAWACYLAGFLSSVALV